MIQTKELRRISKSRLKDAVALLNARRYDGAIYLCGYAIEIALKARICAVLRWSGFPSSSAEFNNYKSFRTHDLDVLLHLTGREQNIKINYLAEWSAVAEWNPLARYQTGKAKKQDVELMITSAQTLLSRI